LYLHDELLEHVSEIDNRVKIDTTELRGLPNGNLMVTKNDGRSVIYRVTYVKGKRKRKSITKDSDMICQMLRREYLEEEVEALKHNKELLLSVMGKMSTVDSTARMRSLMERYPWMSDEQLKAAITAPDAGDDSWNSTPLNMNFFNEGSLRHVTSWGLRVRSKSEALIAEMFHKYDICFKYESALDVDGTNVYPDFKIRRADGKIIWWEHRGLMNNREYSMRQHQKDIIYEENGIVPWDNFVVSYDNLEGDINLKIVEGLIKTWLIV